MEQAREILRGIPLFADSAEDDVSLERLGGLTNRNYRVVGPTGDFVLRIGGPGTAAYIDRAAEAHNARVAAAAGVSPEVLYADSALGVMLTRFVEGAAPLNNRGFEDLAALGRVAAALRRLHDSPAPFLADFDPFALIDRYLRIIGPASGLMSEELGQANAGIVELRRALAAHPPPRAPCHCDLLSDNLLDDGERVTIVDFEFSGNADPLWDLGDLSGETELDARRERHLLESYLGRPGRPHEVARLQAHKAVSLLLAGGWALVQVVNDNPALDFRHYARVRLARCRDLLQAPEFPQYSAQLWQTP